MSMEAIASVIKTTQLATRLNTVKFSDQDFTIMEYYLYDQEGNESSNEYLDSLNLQQILVQTESEEIQSYYPMTLSFLTKKELIELVQKLNCEMADIIVRNNKPKPLIL